MKRRALSLLLILCLLLGLVPSVAVTAKAADTPSWWTDPLPGWWETATDEMKHSFWNYDMKIVNEAGTGKASQIRHYYGDDLKGIGDPAYMNYSDMAAGMGNYDWTVNFESVNANRGWFRWLGVAEGDNYRNSDIIYVPYSVEFTVPAYTEYEITWSYNMLIARHSKGSAGFYTEIFSWGDEFPDANTVKFMTGDTNQASPNAVTRSDGTRLYSALDSQRVTVSKRISYANGTGEPMTFTPKFGILVGVGKADSLSSAYHHAMNSGVDISAQCEERPFNEPIVRVDGVDYQDMGKAVEAFNASPKGSSTIDFLKDVELKGEASENAPVYTLTHDGAVELNGHRWEVGGFAVQSGKSVKFSHGALTRVGNAATFMANSGNLTLEEVAVDQKTGGSTGSATGIYTTAGQVTLRQSSLRGVQDGILAAGGTVTIEDGSTVRPGSLTGSAIRTTGNAAVQISDSTLAANSGTIVDMSGGGTLRLSGNVRLNTSGNKYIEVTQIDLGSSAMLTSGGSTLDKPAAPYSVRVAFDEETGCRTFTNGWNAIHAQGTAMEDYFVNRYTVDGKEPESIIPGGHLVMKDNEVAIAHNAVNFDPAGGTLEGSATLYTDMAGKLGELPTAGWTARSFAGWYNEDETRRCTASTVFSEAETSLHAVWGEAGILVTPNKNQGGGADDDLTDYRRNVVLGKPYNYIYGKYDAQALPTVSRNGYTFDGWYTQAEGGAPVTDDTIVTNEQPHTIYAHWIPNTYKMTIANLNGGALPEGVTLPEFYTLTYGETYPELPTPTKEGYAFQGWRNQYSHVIEADGSQTVTDAYDQRLTAQWKKNVYTYQVTFDLNGEGAALAGGASATMTVYGGERYSYDPSGFEDIELPWTNRANYTFDGWYTQQEGGDLVTETSTVPILADGATEYTLYAHWIRKSCTVTFYDGYKVVGTVIVPAGDTVTPPELPPKTGYTLNGWRTQRYGGGEVWDFDTPVTWNVPLFTHWTSHILTVRLDPNGGKIYNSSYSTDWGYNKLEDTVYGDLPAATSVDETKEFLGWYTEAEGGTPVTAETALPTTDHTLYAHWGPRRYAVKLDPNGGTCDITSMKADTEGALTETLPTPTRNGYDFGGWFTEKTGGTEVTQATTLTADITAYAHWTRAKRTVTFDAGEGGSVAPASKVVIPGEPFGALPTPSKPNYRFVAWMYGGEEMFVSTPVPIVDGDITLTARWEPRIYTVTLDGNGSTFTTEGGGAATVKKRVRFGDPYSGLPTPEDRAGYTFANWNTKADGTGDTAANGDALAVNRDHTLFAQWTPHTYRVTLNAGEGSVSPNEVSVTYGGTYGELPKPTQSGKVFIGWYNASGVQVTASTAVEAQEGDGSEIILTAHWRDDHVHTVGGGEEKRFEPWPADNTPADGKYYYLEADVELTGAVNIYSANVTICLNGHTLKGVDGQYIFYVGQNGTLNLCDCQGGGKVTYEADQGNADGAVYVCNRDSGSAVFNLYSGTITGNAKGRGVYVDRGTFDMYGGAITGNGATGTGATGSGGGVYCRTDETRSTTPSSFTMTGGVIANNTATGSGGGVYASNGYNASAQITLGGSARITGNTGADSAASNLYLNDAYGAVAVTISDSAPLAEGASIGVSPKTFPGYSNPFSFATGGSGSSSAYFTSDAEGYGVECVTVDGVNTLRMFKGFPPHNHPLCGGTEDCNDPNHAAGHSDAVQYVPLDVEVLQEDETHAHILPAGNYFLLDDFTTTYSIVISGGTVNLCLNGHTLKWEDTDTEGPDQPGVVYVQSGATLNLCDCENTGAITGNKHGSGVRVDGATFRMYSGSISGNTMTAMESSSEARYGHGGGVGLNTNAQFEMYGGSIHHNSAYYGGGVGRLGGDGARTVRMYGGSISDNTATYRGGGVEVLSNVSFIMYGGEITSNQVTETAYGGGGVYVNNSSTAVFEMRGGSIIGNQAAKYGGGILLMNGSSNTGGSLTLEGKVTISNNQAEGKSNDLFLRSESGTIVPIKIGEKGLDQDVSIGFSTDSNYKRPFTEDNTEQYLPHFFCQREDYGIWAANGVLYHGSKSDMPPEPHAHPAVPDGETVTFSALGTSLGTKTLYNGGRYYLTGDTTCESLLVDMSGKVILCLNGYTLTGTSESYATIAVLQSGTLTLCDCKGGGKITHTSAGGTYPAKGGGVSIGVKATLNQYGGAITGCTASTSGGGVYISASTSSASGGTYNLYGGEVGGNTAPSGGGVYVEKGGVFNLLGGEISGNVSTGTGSASGGGGVYAAGGSTVNLLGGTVIGNNAANQGGGVYAAGAVTVGGGVNVQSNTKGTPPDATANNIYLLDGKTITVSADPALAEDAKLGVTTQTAPTEETPVVIVTGGGTGLKDHFTSDSGHTLQEGDGGLTLIPGSGSDADDPSITPPEDPPTAFTVVFAYPDGGETKTVTLTTDDNGTLTGQELPIPTRDGYIFGGWYLDDGTPVTTTGATPTRFTGDTTVTAQWSRCSHTEATPEVTTAATCSQAGEITYTCSCGATWTETVDILGHAWSDWAKADDDQHTRTCSVGSETQTADHVWAEDVERKQAPSCTQEGRSVYVCSVCSAEKTETIPTTPHDFSGEWEKDESGHWQVCSACGAAAAPQKHIFTETETAQPTCDTVGTLTLTCSACGYAATEDIPALGHSYESDWQKDADGHWHVCTRDAAHTSEKLSHSWDGGTVATAATTEAKGTTRYTCVDCGQTKSEQDIPMIPTYTVTYVPGDHATGEKVTESGKTTGESITIAACTFTRTGYTFAGWGYGENTYEAGVAFSMLPGDVTFTARWTLVLPFALKAGDTVVLDDGVTVSRSPDGATVTVKKDHVNPDEEPFPETKITVSAGDTVTLVNDPVSMPGLDPSGNPTEIVTDRTVVELPGGSKVQSGENAPEVTIPDEGTAKVTLDGTVYDIPNGTTVTSGDTTITVDSEGGCVSMGGDVTFTGEEDGQVTVQTEGEEPVPVTVPKDGDVSVVQDPNTKRVGGKVVDSEGNPVANATVELRQGGTVYGKATTLSDGSYTFIGVYPGTYDLVVSEGGKTLTELVEIKDDSETIEDARLTDNASILQVTEGTGTEVVVGGLDAEADAQQGSVTMTVTQQTEEEAGSAGTAIKALAGEDATLEYLNAAVEKGGTPGTETTTVIELIIPFEFAAAEGDVTVYRVYNGEAEALQKSTDETAKAEGTFYPDPAAGVIHVYTSKFPTFALGYAKQSAGTGGGNTPVAPGQSVTTDDGTKVENHADGSVTITGPEGGATNITMPEGGDGNISVNTETGEIKLPDGSKVQTDGGPEITLPDGGKVDSEGNVTGETVQVGSTTVSNPGGEVTTTPDGSTTVPGGSEVTVTDGKGGEATVTVPEGGTATVQPDGSIQLPAGGSVTIPDGEGGSTTVTMPEDTGGTVSTDPDGNLVVPGGSTVTKPDGTTDTVPEGGGTVKPDGTVEGNTTSGDGRLEDGETVTTPDGSTIQRDGDTIIITGSTGTVTTVTLPTGTGDVPVNEQTGEVTVPDGSTVQTGEGPEIILPDGGRVNTKGEITLDPGAAAVVGGREITVGPGGTVDPDGTVKSGELTVGGTTVTVPVGGGTADMDVSGEITVPGGTTVQTGEGTEITVGDQGGSVDPTTGAVTVPGGGSVTIPDGNGGTTEITVPDDAPGAVTPNTDGSVEAPGGSEVIHTDKDGNTTTGTVPEGGGTVKPDGTVETGDTPTPIQYTVTFDAMGGEPVPEAQRVTEGETATEPDTPTKDGYTFKGWFTAAAGGTLWRFNTDAVTGNMTLYARWEETAAGTPVTPGNPVVLPDGTKVEQDPDTGNVTITPGGEGGTTTIVPGEGDVTVDDDGNVTVPGGSQVTTPGGTAVELPDGGKVDGEGNITLPDGGDAVTVPGEGGTAITITAPDGGGTLITDPDDGTITVPGGSTVKPGNGTEITVPDGSIIDPTTGDITVPGGSDVIIDDGNGNQTTITTPEDGGNVKPTDDGEVEVPEGTTVTTEDGTTLTVTEGTGIVAPDGTITMPGGGKVTIIKDGKTIIVIVAPGGSVGPDYTEPAPPTPSGPSGPSGPGGSGGGSGYAPNIQQPDHGKITVSPSRPVPGDKVIVTVTPEEGYELDVITVTDEDGNSVEVTRNPDGTFTFIQPTGAVNISATMKEAACPKDETCPIHAFRDAGVDAWYHDGVHFCLEKGLMMGTSGTTFAPGMPTSRAMIATILWRCQGSPVVNYAMDYPDVAEGTWYTEAVRWATSEGIVKGYGDGRFGPNDPTTREQVATMLYRYEQKYGGGGFTGNWMFLLDFADAGQVSGWANEAIHWMTMNKVITGKGKKVLDPQGNATRAEVAAMLQRFCGLS